MSQSRQDDEPAEPDGGVSLWERLRRWRGVAEPDEQAASEMAALSALEAHERTLITNVLHLRNLSAADVMVPRVDIIAVEVETDFAQMVKLLVEEGHSRLPVFEGDLDRILGMIHVKDVLSHVVAGTAVPLRELVRPVLFAAPSTRMLDLLSQMRQQRAHMAFVVDEFGGIDGLVTIEDLVEQIVGEIEDEHDEIEPSQIVERPDGSLIADGRASIEDLDAILGTALTPEAEEEVDTLGGLVLMLSGHVPHKGEIIRHPSGTSFEVLDADERRVIRLRIHRKNEAAPAPDAG